MSTATIYATAVHKQKESYGCYGISVWKKNARKPVEKLGHMDSESKIKTQLSTLIHSLSFVEKIPDLDEVKLYTDFSLIQNFLDGTIIDWERNDWIKSNEKPVPHADLWQELSSLAVEYNIQFIAPKETDDKMMDITKKMKRESRKPKKLVGKKAKTPLKPEDAPISIEEEILDEDVVGQDVIDQIVAQLSAKFNYDIQTEITAKDLQIGTSTEENAKKLPTSEEIGNISLDPKLIKECEALFDEIGMPVEVAITMFLKHTLRKKGLTIDLKLGE